MIITFFFLLQTHHSKHDLQHFAHQRSFSSWKETRPTGADNFCEVEDLMVFAVRHMTLTQTVKNHG